MLNHRLFPLSLITIAVLSACAMTPEKESPLEQARSGYARAQGDPQVVRLAADELSQAGAALNKANDAFTKRESSAQVDQLAYLAKQKTAIAQETATQKAAELAAASASAERESIRLEARTAEADAAHKSAAASQQNAAASQRNAEASLLAAEAAQRQSSASQRSALDAEARSRELELQLKELDAKKTVRGLVITLADVLFDVNKAELRTGGMRGVNKLADVLKQYPKHYVLVEGFTDNTGSSSHNQDLSNRRAASVRTALMETGISAGRIENRGYGETFPVASNGTAAGRQLNRRVEIIVSEEGIAPR